MSHGHRTGSCGTLPCILRRTGSQWGRTSNVLVTSTPGPPCGLLLSCLAKIGADQHGSRDSVLRLVSFIVLDITSWSNWCPNHITLLCLARTDPGLFCANFVRGRMEPESHLYDAVRFFPIVRTIWSLNLRSLSFQALGRFRDGEQPARTPCWNRKSTVQVPYHVCEWFYGFSVCQTSYVNVAVSRSSRSDPTLASPGVLTVLIRHGRKALKCFGYGRVQYWVGLVRYGASGEFQLTMVGSPAFRFMVPRLCPLSITSPMWRWYCRQ